jgi:hypothetical protein
VVLWRSNNDDPTVQKFSYNLFGGYKHDFDNGKEKVKNDHNFLRGALLYGLFMNEDMRKFKRIKFWSDTGPGHFLLQRSLVLICYELRNEYPHLISTEWNFFAENHGKSRADAEGGGCRMLIRRLILGGEEIHTPSELILALNKHRKCQFSSAFKQVEPSSRVDIKGISLMRDSKNAYSHHQWTLAAPEGISGTSRQRSIFSNVLPQILKSRRYSNDITKE